MLLSKIKKIKNGRITLDSYDPWDEILNPKKHKRLTLEQIGPDKFVWIDEDTGERSVIYGSRGTADQMKRQDKIQWKDKCYDSLPSINFQGLKIDIENKKGSFREHENGKTEMFYDYGYFQNTEGVDGDEIDVFVGPNKDSDKVFVIRNMIDGEFDEHKIMLGFNDEFHARDAFLAHYDDSSHLGQIKELSIEKFKKWLIEETNENKTN